MPFPTIPAPGDPLPLAADADWMCAGLDLSPTPLLLCHPIFGPDEELLDFAFDYLNLPAQRRLMLSAQPGGTVRTHFSAAQAPGMVRFCQRVFEAGIAGPSQANTPAEGSEAYGPLTARRSGTQLVVSLPDAVDNGRWIIEAALRTSQAHEADALAEALRQRQRLLAVFEEAPGLIARLSGPDHVIELANDAFRQAFGGRELVGKPYREAAPELSDQFFFDWLDAVYRTGETHYGNEVLALLDRTNSGQLDPSYYNFTYQATRNAAGAVAGVLVFAYDVSEQVRARQQLLQLNQELETRVAERTRAAMAAQDEVLAAARRQLHARASFYQVFEQTPAVIALLRGPEHRIEFYNAAFQQLFAGRELRDRPMGEVAPETASQGFVALLDGVYQTGATHFGTEVPLVLKQPAGQPSQIHYFTFTYQRFEEDGKPAGISVFAYDVAEQVLARQAREQQQQELEDLFMQAPAPIVILDGPGLVFQLVNPAYQRIFPDRDLVGKPLLDAMPELVDTPIPALFRQVYETGEPYVAEEMPLMMARYEGGPLEEIYWTFSYQARRDAHGAVDGVRVFAHEVTEPVRARQLAVANAQQARALAQELTTANQRLSRANADLDAFAYTAAHDLRGPVANLGGLLEALLEQLPPAVRTSPDVEPVLDLMQGALTRFGRTLDQLTAVIREQAAQDQPAETVDLAALVEDVRLDLAPLLGKGTPQLLVDVTGCPRLAFAPRNLRSIVYNLLSNALKYRDPAREPMVHVRCHALGGNSVLEVADNGVGLSESQQSRLFGLFQRLHTHVEGSGLGLYTVKKIVENVGGTIAVQSQPGVGTTFTITLPGADPDAVITLL